VMSNSILQIRDLRVTFNTQMGELKAVRGIDVDVNPGEILGVVGESGSGKSVSFLAAMGLLPSSSKILCRHSILYTVLVIKLLR
jgi:ABC-type dipeptide/oligopeptide/nickel transport system ATPase component